MTGPIARRSSPNNYFEDFKAGQVFEHARGKTVTEMDNVLFTTLTMNPQPLHLDAEFAKTTEFGRPLVNSILTLAVVTGLAVTDVSENGFALGWDLVTMPNPVFAGDTLYSQSEVVDTRESRSKPEWGIVKVRTRGVKQDGTIVIDYTRSVMVWKRAHAPSRDLFPPIKE